MIAARFLVGNSLRTNNAGEDVRGSLTFPPKWTIGFLRSRDAIFLQLYFGGGYATISPELNSSTAAAP